VVYIFKRERASHAGRCLAAGTLHLYQVLVSRSVLHDCLIVDLHKSKKEISWFNSWTVAFCSAKLILMSVNI
jgi:hypothetical protein